MNVVAYPKSGSHLMQHVLRAGGIESAQSHVPRQWPGAIDLHVMRDIRAIVPSAVCHFVLQRPEKDPALIRPHCMEMAQAMLGDWKGLGFAGWSAYVARTAHEARHTVIFADLVARPRAALLPLVDIGDEAEAAMAKERLVLKHMDPAYAWAGKFKFRSGTPEGWRETLGADLSEEIAAMFRPGLDLLERYRLGVAA